MMKKLVALLMALALLCTSIGAFATETTSEPAAETTSEPASQVPGVDEPNTDHGYNGDVKPYTEYMATLNDPTHKEGYRDPAQHKDATCTEPSKDVLRCKDCGLTYEYSVTPALKHQYNEADVAKRINPDKPRTCTENGELICEVYCSRCDKTVQWTEVLEAQGHKWDDGVVKSDADCENDEVRTYTCTVTGCGATKEETVEGTKLQHTWEEDEWQDKHEHVTKDLTCAQDGEIGNAQICDRCGKINPNTIDSLRVIKHIDHAEEWEDRVAIVTDEDDEVVYTYDWKSLLKQLGLSDEYIDGLSVSDYEDEVEWLLWYNQYSNDLLKTLKLTAKPTITYALPEGVSVDLTTAKEIPAYEITVEGVKGTVEKAKVEYTAPECDKEGSLVLTCTKECGAEPYTITLPAHGHLYMQIRDEQEGNKVTDCTKANSAMFQCLFCGDRYSQAIKPADKHTIEFDTENFDPDELVWYDDNCQIVSFVQQKEWDGEAITYAVKFDGIADSSNFGVYKTAVKAAFENIAVCRDYKIVVKCDIGFCKYTEAISVAGNGKHTHGKNYFKTEQSCTVAAYEYYNCKDCGKPVSEYLGYANHTPVIDTENVVEPTCTETGVRPYICEVCKEPLYTEVIPAVGHHLLYTTYEANCQLDIDGYEVAKCSKCDYEKTIRTWTGHEPEDGVEPYIWPAKCTEDGYKTYTCKNCHRDVTEPIPALGHTYERKNAPEHICVTKEQNAKYYCQPATCKNGAAHANIHYYFCTECNAEPKMVVEGEVPEHTMFRTETVNGKEETVLNNFYIEKLPTCTEKGKAQYVCSLCNEPQDLELAMIPHNFELTFDEVTGTYKLTCVQMEKTEANKTKLLEMLVKEAKYNEKVAEAVVDELYKTTAKYLKGIGNCGTEQTYDVRKTEYTIERISATRGAINLVEGALPAHDEVSVLVTWRYETADGETYAFSFVLPVTWEDRNEEGTFSLKGSNPPKGGKCSFIYVEVVTDPDADEKYDYTCYGETEVPVA